MLAFDGANEAASEVVMKEEALNSGKTTTVVATKARERLARTPLLSSVTSRTSVNRHKRTAQQSIKPAMLRSS